jgi:aminomuconate-semialdehyde/2-hydroxymuconate-6-semialdehyde dehydrogenase
MRTHLNFIGGEFSAAFGNARIVKQDPRTSTPQANVADSDLMDVVRSVQAGNKALVTWLKSTQQERSNLLSLVATSIESHAQALADAIESDLGTAPEVSLQFSIPEAVEHFREHAIALMADAFEPTMSIHAIGLVGVITPASDPLVCLSSRVAPALAVGNAVIAKVSRYTPATGELFARLLHEAGLPAGVFSLLQGRGESVGEALVQHPALSSISFMGSTEKGRHVANVAAESLKKMHFSLGAKNPVLVFADTDLSQVLPQVARICLGLHPSQCLKGSRLFIQETVFKTALEQLKHEFDKIRVAPLAKIEQATAYRSAVQLALKENGKVITGGSLTKDTGHFVKPHLFADLTNCSTLQQDEIAGPLVLASSFKYQHEALKYANVSPYGRVSYVFEHDPEKASRVAQKLETGSVFINKPVARFSPLEEISLLKNSGLSPEGGRPLLRFFSRQTKIFS